MKAPIDTTREIQDREVNLALARGEDPGAMMQRYTEDVVKGGQQAQHAATNIAALAQGPQEMRDAVRNSLAASPNLAQLNQNLTRVQHLDQAIERFERVVAARNVDRISASVMKDVARDIRVPDRSVSLIPGDSLSKTGASWGLKGFRWGMEWQSATVRDRAESIRNPWASYRIDAAGRIGIHLATERYKISSKLFASSFGRASKGDFAAFDRINGLSFTSAVVKSAPDLVEAGARHYGTGHMTMDIARQYQSGFAKLSGETFGALAGASAATGAFVWTGNPALASLAYKGTSLVTSEVIQKFVVPAGEGATRPVFEAAGRWIGTNASPSLNREINTLQQSAIARGLPQPTRQSILDGTYAQELYRARTAAQATSPDSIPRTPSGSSIVKIRKSEAIPEILKDIPFKPPPGGVRTASDLPYWTEDEWPFAAWYGLAYVVQPRPNETAEETKR